MKRLVLMRGIPGGGKSYKAKEIAYHHLVDGGQTIAICSTDSYHMVNGEYVFDAVMLPQFHELNHKRAEQFMRCETELVIIDNTNIKHRDMKPYKDSAYQLGYTVEEVIVGEEYLVPGDEMTRQLIDGYINLCAKRNTHGVPLEAIERMARKFQE